jgi:thiosulfate reductase cytochrome b subunit
MADNDQHSHINLAAVEHEEPMTILQPPMSESPDVEGSEVRIDWTESASIAKPAGDETVWVTGSEHAVRTPRRERRREPRFPRPHLFVTLCHWAMVMLLGLSFITGMRIGWGYLESPFRWLSLRLASIAPKGSLLGVNIITLHVVLAFFMLGVAGIYVAYMFRSGASRRMRVTRQTFQRLRRGAFEHGLKWNKSSLWVSNLLVYWVGFTFVFVLILTGIALYRLDWGLSSLLGGYGTARWLHSLLAYLLLPYIVLHMVLQWCFGRFWTIFKAQSYAPHIRAGLHGVALILPLAVAFYVVNEMPVTLTAKRIPANMQAPTLDGDASDPVWQYADSITVRTVKGVNNPTDHVDVAMQALHDEKYVYFKFEWNDPEASYKRFPLLKTADGWRMLETAYKWGDENVYYEDKLSMYVTDVTGGSCADTCHIGVGPHAARGEKHGLHYTNGVLGDVWHWKAVRTNHMHVAPNEPGYMDDQYFRAPDLPMPTDPKERYTAGYHPDPQSGGGYSYNYIKLDKDKPLSEARVQPRFLPRHPLHLRPNPDPTTSEAGYQWWLHKATSLPYSEALDTYPVGTLLPNMVVEPFQGGRADIRAKAQWSKGRWTLEARRVLDTHSEFDVALSTERPVYLTVATYNRTQTRHSEQIKPVQLTLEK